MATPSPLVASQAARTQPRKHRSNSSGAMRAKTRPREDASDGVVRRDAVLERQESPQPVLLGLPELFDGREAVGSADDRADGDSHDLVEAVLFAFCFTRVLKRREPAGDVAGGMLSRCRHRMNVWYGCASGGRRRR